MRQREERYWKFGRELLQIPVIVDRFKGERQAMEYEVPVKPKSSQKQEGSPNESR